MIEELHGSVISAWIKIEGAAGLSLTVGAVLCPWVRHFILCLVLVQPRNAVPTWHDWKTSDWDGKDKRKVLLPSDSCQRITFSNDSFRNTIWVSNVLDPDQARHFVCKGYQETTKVPAYKERINGYSYKCDWCYFVSPIFIGGAICLTSILPIFIGGAICLTSISAAQCRFWILILALLFKPNELEKCPTTCCTCLRFGVTPCSNWIFTLSLPLKTCPLLQFNILRQLAILQTIWTQIRLLQSSLIRVYIVCFHEKNQVWSALEYMQQRWKADNIFMTKLVAGYSVLLIISLMGELIE